MYGCSLQHLHVQLQVLFIGFYKGKCHLLHNDFMSNKL